MSSLREVQMKSRNDQSERRLQNNGNHNNYNQMNEENSIIKKPNFRGKIQNISKNIFDLKNQLEFIKNKIVGVDSYSFADIQNVFT